MVDLRTGATPQSTGKQPEVDVRILATTDLHACLTSWDYFTNLPALGRGLSRIASLMAAARAKATNVLQFDNGDFLTGSGLGDYMAQIHPAAFGHPMVLAMNALGYDAVNLGNHEFSHGLDHLRHSLRDAAFPIVSTNFDIPSLDKLQKIAILTRTFLDRDGAQHLLRIGVLGLLPSQTMVWEALHLRGQAAAYPMIDAAHAAARDLRAQGADLVIALAHTGLSTTENVQGEESSAEIIAEIPGIDAVIAGHSHQVYPTEGGHAQSRAMVLPGHYGSHLGVLDLVLRKGAGGWHKVAQSAEARPIAQRTPGTGAQTALVADAPAITALAQDIHSKILTQSEQVIGKVPHRVYSYFATIVPCDAMALLGEVQRCALSQALVGTPLGHLPVLAATAPFKVGGRGGPDNYTDLPAGPFQRHHAADLYMHPNRFVGFRVTGAELALWLERSVSKYSHFPPGTRDEMLHNPDFPSFNCDIIHGVTYQIDLTRPPMFDTHGVQINPGTQRIADLRYCGEPVQAAQIFAVASNSFRREGQAGFAGTSATHVIYESPVLVQDLLLRHIAAGHPVPKADPLHWRFVPVAGSTALVQSSPKSADVIADIAHFNPEPLGVDCEGFLRFRLHL